MTGSSSRLRGSPVGDTKEGKKKTRRNPWVEEELWLIMDVANKFDAYTKLQSMRLIIQEQANSACDTQDQTILGLIDDIEAWAWWLCAPEPTETGEHSTSDSGGALRERVSWPAFIVPPTAPQSRHGAKRVSCFAQVA